MTYGTIEEIVVVERYVDPDDFREALDHAPPGIMDERSWAYWNARDLPGPAHAAACHPMSGNARRFPRGRLDFRRASA